MTERNRVVLDAMSAMDKWMLSYDEALSVMGMTGASQARMHTIRSGAYDSDTQVLLACRDVLKINHILEKDLFPSDARKSKSWMTVSCSGFNFLSPVSLFSKLDRQEAAKKIVDYLQSEASAS